MAEKAVVHTSVSLGTPNELSGFGLAVDIKVEGVDDEVLKAGHEVCILHQSIMLHSSNAEVLSIQPCFDSWCSCQHLKSMKYVHEFRLYNDMLFNPSKLKPSSRLFSPCPARSRYAPVAVANRDLVHSCVGFSIRIRSRRLPVLAQDI